MTISFANAVTLASPFDYILCTGQFFCPCIHGIRPPCFYGPSIPFNGIVVCHHDSIAFLPLDRLVDGDGSDSLDLILLSRLD